MDIWQNQLKRLAMCYTKNMLKFLSSKWKTIITAATSKQRLLRKYITCPFKHASVKIYMYSSDQSQAIKLLSKAAKFNRAANKFSSTPSHQEIVKQNICKSKKTSSTSQQMSSPAQSISSPALSVFTPSPSIAACNSIHGQLMLHPSKNWSHCLFIFIFLFLFFPQKWPNWGCKNFEMACSRLW